MPLTLFSANVQNNPFLIHIAAHMYSKQPPAIHIYYAASANATATNAALAVPYVHARRKSLKSQINGL